MARILIIRFSALGDVAMTIPVIHSLAVQYPQHEITVLSRAVWQPLFQGLPANVGFVGADLTGKHKGLWGLNSLYSELKAMHFDYIADFHHVLRSKYLCLRFRLANKPVASICKGRAGKKKLVRRHDKVMENQKSSFRRYADVLEKLGLPVLLNFSSIYGEGKGNFAAIAEVVPLRIQKVADSATLDDVTIKVGEKVRLEAKHDEDTILTGIVWSSSDKEVVKVNQNGVVTGLKTGTATITIKNAIGKLASCTVTVTKDEVILDKEDLQKAIDKAETLDLDKYKDGVEKDAFKAALSQAKDVLANAKTQDEIDKATSELNAAINALKEVEKPVEPSADKSKLEKFYKDCLAYYKETNHSKENWQKYQTVLAYVKAVLENENATQDEVDNALKVLVEITGILNKELEDAGKEPTTPPTPTTPNGEGNNGGNGNVTTGDMTTWGMTAVVMLLAVGAVVVVIRRKRETR